MDTGRTKGIVQIYYRCSSFTRNGHLLHLVTSSLPVLLRTLEAISLLQRLINEPRCHLDLRRSFFSYRVIDRWNDLPQSIIDSGTINTFKNGLNKLRKRASSWTNRSAWPIGLISSEGFRRAGAAAPGMS